MSNHRSQSNLSALSLFDKAVSLELHVEGITTCVMQVVAFRNDTMMSDTLSDISESKAYPKKTVAEVVSAIKAACLACKQATAEMVRPASKKDTENLTAMLAVVTAEMAAYAVIVGPLVNKTPTVKTEEEKASAKQKAALSAAVKAEAWAKENGWVSPDRVSAATAEAFESAEIKRLQSLLDDSREETAVVSAKLAESVTKRAELHGENAMLRGQVTTLTASVDRLQVILHAVRAIPKVSKAVLAAIGE